MATLHTSNFPENHATSTSYTHSLVFIDMAVEDYSDLINGVLDNAQVFVLDSTQNGVEQITKILANWVDAQQLAVRHCLNLTDIHIVCHGVPGCLQLGNTHLGLDTLDEYSQQLQQWQKIFSASGKSDNPSNLLIYGCNVASGDAGAEFVEKLHQLTGANIAASRQRIGNAALGGNWELEVRTADMEVNLAFVQTTREAYPGVLATFTVNNTGDTDDGDANNGITTLREAINLANATSGDDTISFGGVFTDNTPDAIALTSGQLTITDDVTILGTGASQLTVSGNNASRVFEISGIGTDAVIDGLTVANGNINTNYYHGSGILVDTSTILRLTNSNVSRNTGEGIYNSGILNLTRSSVSGNTGSGIINNLDIAFLNLMGSSVSGNTGSGISNFGSTVNLTNSSVFSNTQSGIANDVGGSLYSLYSGFVSLTNSSVSDNRAEGISNLGSFLKLTNSSVSGNREGGISNSYFSEENFDRSSSAILINSTVSGNKATHNGGGIYNNDTLSLINTTITNNTADSDGDGTGDGGGVFNDGGTITVGNTIIAGNFDKSTPANIYPDLAGSFNDSGNNLIGNNTGSTGFTTSTLVGTSTSPINPKLGPLQNNGGATFTDALLADSPAINSGNNSLVTGSVTTDQRGAGFNRISDDTVDIGAYEVQSTSPPAVNTDTVVTNTNDSGAGSLRQAILNANATVGADTITFAGVFADATPDIITLTSGKLTITDDLTILGTGVSNLTISGNNASGVFEISGTGTDTSINNLKIANARDAFGSILINSNASLSLTNSTVSDNRGSVGGIFNRGSLSLTNTTVSDNMGSSLAGGIFNSGNLKLTGSTVSDNRGDTYGGGIFNKGSLSLTNSTVSSNHLDTVLFSTRGEPGAELANSYGGGIFNTGNLRITASTVSNSEATYGGGIFNQGTFNLNNSTVSSNTSYIEGNGISNKGTLTLINSTITNNYISPSSAFGDDGQFHDFYYGQGRSVFNDPDGTVIVGNTIIAGNFGLQGDVFGSFTDLGSNLIGNSTGSTGFIISTLVGTSANPINPKLTPLQNNGGATLTHALLENSPAINAGKNALIPASITTDQRGAGFDRISEGTVDIGALEFNGLTGTTGADNLMGKNYSDIINAQAGNDIITGNQGNDILTGGGGKDEFVYNLSDGVDTITDFGGLGKGSNPSAAIASELDTLKFQGTGLTARNLLLTQNTSNLEITFEGVADDEVILQNFPLENLDNLSTLGNILFDGQSSIRDSFDVFNPNSTQNTIFNKNTVTFLNDLNNNVNGFENSDDVINGQEGDDYINGKSGNDLLRGGTGNDTLIGGAGDDIIIGGQGSNNLSGGAGNDILFAGDYKDTLSGGSGSDQFIYQVSSTNHTITDFNQSEDKLVLTDVLKGDGYSGSNPIGDGYLTFVQSGISTQVNDYYNQTLATLNNFTATNLVVGTNVIV
ncbi:DUF4347 domain-containing protein [Nostoc sp.]|uniref:DUF4347 domain-containing protein n=1 Tax=Nostoc sp. TaxID=1180 RepID=UPI002FF74FF7